jgi:hypothetical protein
LSAPGERGDAGMQKTGEKMEEGGEKFQAIDDESDGEG